MAKVLCKIFDKDLKNTGETKIYRNMNLRQIEKIVSKVLLTEEHPKIDIYEFTDIYNPKTYKLISTIQISTIQISTIQKPTIKK